jgi:hypothetical protein
MPEQNQNQRLSVADPVKGRTRVLSRQCDTCIFGPGNPMRLAPGRLAQLVQQAQTSEGFIVCHDTLPYGPHPDYGPAVCRGFYDRYDTQALQIARRLWGISEVPPPADGDPSAATTAPATTAGRDTAASGDRASGGGGAGPLVFVDVDGVLNPTGRHPQTHGYRPHPFAHLGPDGKSTGGTVWLHPDHGPWLTELARSADLVWATSWGQLANTWISPRIGLPGTWPVVELAGRGGVRFGHNTKLDIISRYAHRRPFALLDDEIGGKDPHLAAHRSAAVAPTLLVPVDPRRGLTRSHIGQLLTWLDTV